MAVAKMGRAEVPKAMISNEKGEEDSVGGPSVGKDGSNSHKGTGSSRAVKEGNSWFRITKGVLELFSCIQDGRKGGEAKGHQGGLLTGARAQGNMGGKGERDDHGHCMG